MKIYDLRCPRCSGSLNISTEQGIIQCNFCGSTLYVDGKNQLKLNENKIAENLDAIFSQAKKDAISNHQAILHGLMLNDDYIKWVHFKDKPKQFDLKADNLPYWLMLACAFICSIILWVIFFSIEYEFFPILSGLFGGIFIGGCLIYPLLIETIYVKIKNRPYRNWENERKEYLDKTKQQFEKSNFIKLLSEDIIRFYFTLIEQSETYNVKSVKFIFSLFPKGCKYEALVDCPYRERINNTLSDSWKSIYHTEISFEENDFIFLNAEQWDVFFEIIERKISIETRGKRTKIIPDKEHHCLVLQYDNTKYKAPSFANIW